MKSFLVQRWDQSVQRLPPGSHSQILGFRAPGPMALILQEGTAWVVGEDGNRVSVKAKSVVLWEAGDWVEYGADGDAGCEFEMYWSKDFSEEESVSRFDPSNI